MLAILLVLEGGVVAIVRYWNFVSSAGHIELLALD